jgi:hypothetical protein
MGIGDFPYRDWRAIAALAEDCLRYGLLSTVIFSNGAQINNRQRLSVGLQGSVSIASPAVCSIFSFAHLLFDCFIFNGKLL